ATWENLTDLTDGSRTAIADGGHAFSGGATTLVVTYALAPQLTGELCGQLVDHDLLSTTATKKNLQCDGGGSYTLANTPGIRWLVNGIEKLPGTYPVANASTVNVEAQIIDTVANGWEDGAQKTWTFDFTDQANCELTTLAFTGVDGSGLWLLFASGLLFLGGIIVVYERRYGANAR
ncbi:MAG: hypothetical protein ABIW32_00410, partial [Terrimesophilobacter sp.]